MKISEDVLSGYFSDEFLERRRQFINSDGNAVEEVVSMEWDLFDNQGPQIFSEIERLYDKLRSSDNNYFTISDTLSVYKYLILLHLFQNVFSEHNLLDMMLNLPTKTLNSLINIIVAGSMEDEDIETTLRVVTLSNHQGSIVKWDSRVQLSEEFSGTVERYIDEAFPNQSAVKKSLCRYAFAFDKYDSFARAMIHVAKSFGVEVLSEILDRCVRECVELDSRDIAKLAINWTRLKDYPLEWSVSVADWPRTSVKTVESEPYRYVSITGTRPSVSTVSGDSINSF